VTSGRAKRPSLPTPPPVHTSASVPKTLGHFDDSAPADRERPPRAARYQPRGRWKRKADSHTSSRPARSVARPVSTRQFQLAILQQPERQTDRARLDREVSCLLIILPEGHRRDRQCGYASCVLLATTRTQRVNSVTEFPRGEDSAGRSRGNTTPPPPTDHTRRPHTREGKEKPIEMCSC
jgi:hypothetical protein